MKTPKITIRVLVLSLALVLLALLLLSGGALAQSGGGHDLTWNSADGGGGTFGTGGGYGLGGTAGQPDAGAVDRRRLQAGRRVLGRRGGRLAGRVRVLSTAGVALGAVASDSGFKLGGFRQACQNAYDRCQRLARSG